MNDEYYLKIALSKASESVAQGGFPAGAIVVKNGEIVGEGISIGHKIKDPTSHGEMSAIREGCKSLGTSELSGCTLYASMQPCVMCLGASAYSGISKIVYACAKEKVSDEYYVGHYNLQSINVELSNPIELVHISELEDESLEVVREWEESFIS